MDRLIQINKSAQRVASGCDLQTKLLPGHLNGAEAPPGARKSEAEWPEALGLGLADTKTQGLGGA